MGAADVETTSTAAVPAKRGVGWVLRWAGTLATIAFSLLKLIDFSYQIDLDQTLDRAARAGALEATLPRASSQSVVQSVERRLSALMTTPDESFTQNEQVFQNVLSTLKITGTQTPDQQASK